MNKISSRAATQLYEIILLLPDDNKAKIPLSIIKLLENKKINTDEVNIKSAEHINNNAILDETKKYLAYIFLKYLANDEEKNEFNHILDENEARHQVFLRNKYDIANIFGVEKENKEDEFAEKLEVSQINIDENNKLIKIEEKRWWDKMLEKIKYIIKK